MSEVLPITRLVARQAAEAIRAAISDPTSAGERAAAHLDLSRPRRGVWLCTWANVPGLTLDCGRRMYSHVLPLEWRHPRRVANRNDRRP